MTYRNGFNVPHLCKENSDLAKKLRRRMISMYFGYGIAAVIAGIIYYIYFFTKGKTYTFGKHFAFWGIFVIICYIFLGIERLFTEKS